MRTALLEDDVAQAQLLITWLEEEKHSCKWFSLGDVFLQNLHRETYDLFILDWEVPDISGIEVLKRLRLHPNGTTPVLFVTNRNREDDIVQALKAGADDYMVKPIRRMELLARMDALQRRNTPLIETPTMDKFSPYTFNRASMVVEFATQSCQLTAKEFEVALFLFHNTGRLLSRAHILESVWGQRAELNTRTVDTHISIIRQKLHLGPQNGWQLATIYGHGYRLEQL